MSIIIEGDDLHAGVVVVYSGVRTTILGDKPEPAKDFFGRDMKRIFARREDTGAEGYLMFGPGGGYVLCPDACPTCGVDLARQGFPFAHQHADTGTECPFTWEPLP